MSAEPVIPVLIMNLPRDAERLTYLRAQFAALPMFNLQIVSGVDGAALPDIICQALTDMSRSPKGTLGCFLSHAAAWEMAARAAAPYVIILEDDVNLRGFDRLHHLSLPGDAELVFINERMSPQWIHSPLEVVGMAPLLLRLDVLRGGLGGDGYILRPPAASKLLQACRKDLFAGHVDGRLLRYAVSGEELAALPEESWIRHIIENHHDKRRLPELGLVKGYTLSQGVVGHRGVASSREHADGTI